MTCTTCSNRNGCTEPPVRSHTGRHRRRPSTAETCHGSRDDATSLRRLPRHRPGRTRAPASAWRWRRERAPELLLGHSSTSTESTMPIMAASTGAPFRPSASPAARPSITTSTFSCTPAPTESTASSAVPRRFVVEREGLHQQQLGSLELRMLLRGDDRADDSGKLHGYERPSTSVRRRPNHHTSKWSTIPTMPASVGTSVGWNGKLASLPRTKMTTSPTPAPTASAATSVLPVECRPPRSAGARAASPRRGSRPSAC